MQILPLKFIHDDDKKIVGENLFNLAKLNHLGIPVVESVVVIPPEQSIKKLLEKYSRLNPDLKNHLENLKQEFLKLQIPETLIDVHTSFLKNPNNFNLDINKLWQNLLAKWIHELISKIERGERNLNFTPQQVVFSSNFSALGKAFFDESRQHVVIQIDKGELNFNLSAEIEKLVNKGNNKLILPQVFYWVIEEGTIKIIKLMPFTQDLVQTETVNPTQVQIPTQRSIPKTAAKFLLDYSGQSIAVLTTDTVLLRLENPNVDKTAILLDKILKINDSTIIFYPNFLGSLEQNLEYAKSFLFFKNKKQLNCQIVLPQTFSIEEFLNLKRQFASLGIYSKGSLKIWKQFKSVADFINVDEYLDAGFDGAIIDLDKLIELIIGVDAQLFLSEPRLDWITSTEKFFKENGFLKLIKNHKQVLITGESIKSEELLNYFLKSGIWGIACKENILDSLREHVSFLEKTIAKKL